MGKNRARRRGTATSVNDSESAIVPGSENAAIPETKHHYEASQPQQKRRRLDMIAPQPKYETESTEIDERLECISTLPKQAIPEEERAEQP